MQPRRLRHALVAGALLLLWGAPARAQFTAAPESLRVVLQQGQEATASVTLTNTGSAGVIFCLDFDRPLQRRGTGAVQCGEPGELLAMVDRSTVEDLAFPYGLTMTPGGRLFVAEYGTFGGAPRYGKTHEFTPGLQYIRTFQHPAVAEFAPFPRTVGVTYDAQAHTLWWTNAEESGGTIHRVMLLEGTLDGVATGRRITLPIPPTGPPPTNTGYPNGASYDPSAGRFYYVDAQNNTLWAIDTVGVVPAGYPVRLARYSGTYYIGNGVDVHGGAQGGAGVRLDVPISLTLDNEFDRVTVTDPNGRDLDVEYPLPTSLAGAIWVGLVLRSRLDPNGVMYAAYGSFGPNGVAAFRPAPLAPSWLALPAWSGTAEPQQSTDLSLTFRAGQRAPGEYRSMLLVEDTSGGVLASVPLTLVVTPDTPAEPTAEDAALSLTVSPNPSAGGATATLMLPEHAGVRLVAYDVLGREVAQLMDGELAPGTHTYEVPAQPAGVYLLRAMATPRVGSPQSTTSRLTIIE